MNFSQGHSGTKIQCESCLFSQGKTPELIKMGEIHELFVLALSLVWFARLAGAFPDTKDTRPLYYKTPPCAFYHKNVRSFWPFSVLSKDEVGPHSKTGRFLSKAEILGVGVFSPLSNYTDDSETFFCATDVRVIGKLIRRQLMCVLGALTESTS